MGMWNNFKDALYITRCISHVDSVLPNCELSTAKFCNKLFAYLLDQKEAGWTPREAVIQMCVYILSKEHKYFMTTFGGIDLIEVARLYTIAFSKRWPDSPYSYQLNTARKVWHDYALPAYKERQAKEAAQASVDSLLQSFSSLHSPNAR